MKREALKRMFRSRIVESGVEEESLDCGTSDLFPMTKRFMIHLKSLSPQCKPATTSRHEKTCRRQIARECATCLEYSWIDDRAQLGIRLRKLKWLAKTKRERRNGTASSLLIYCFVSGMLIESLTQLSTFASCNSVWSILNVKSVGSPGWILNETWLESSRETATDKRAHRFYSEHNRTLMVIPRKWTNNLGLIVSCSET